MKISYRTQGSGGYSTLADEAATPAEWIVFDAPRMQGLAQVTDLFRAANAFVSARKNRKWAISFRVNREHTDLATALAYTQSHPAALPDFQDLKVESSGTTLYAVKAVMVGCEGQQQGRSTVFAYSFVAQSWTSTAP